MREPFKKKTTKGTGHVEVQPGVQINNVSLNSESKNKVDIA